MAMIIGSYDWVFNDVQFGLDVKSARRRESISAHALALAAGWQSEVTIYSIENARYSDYLKLRHLIAICNLLNLHIADYFEIEPASKVDLLKKLT